MKTIKIKSLKKVLAAAMVCCSSLFATSACAESKGGYEQRAEVKQFIDEMVSEHKFDRTYLEERFSSAKKLENILQSIAKPAEKELVWKQYRPIFVTEKRSDKGKAFLAAHREVLERAEKEYGVPAEIITAIIGVETYYGKHTGKYTIFDSLTTLAFDYPPRSKFFRSELKQFLLLSKEENISVEDMTGSYAGAMGMPQFISSSYRRYAVDFDGDGKRDLWNSLPDVIGSVANYFSEHGWVKDEDVTFEANVKDASIVKEKNELKPYATISELQEQGVTTEKPFDKDKKATLLKFEGGKGDEYWLGFNNFYVITRYNHNAMYAMAVFQLSESIK